MADSSTAAAEATPGKNIPRAKDRNCPFCNQAFTSSSLGRHLDLYIREKNPKPPDGLHNVDDIRRMRQGITRRHMRGGKRESSLSVQPAPPNSMDAPASDEGSPVFDQTPSLNIQPGEKVRFKVNEPSWLVTGVINNLPPRPATESRSSSRHFLLKSELDQRRKATDELETGRAAELALKEVLGAVRDVASRTIGGDLFDFDPYTLNFPSLCLHILPQPPTLFSPTPFPTSESWSINPPGQKQFEALNKVVNERLILHKANNQGGKSPSSFSSSTPTSSSPTLIELNNKIFTHISDAFSHWTTLSEKQRQDTWQLEILRSYSRAEQTRLKCESELAATKRKLEFLKSNAERVGHWISAGDFEKHDENLHLSPLQRSAYAQFSSDVVKDLWMQKDFDIHNWDFDRLISKWKSKARTDRQQNTGMAAQRSLSVSSLHQRTERKNSQVSHTSSVTNTSTYQQPIRTSNASQIAPTETGDSDSVDVMDEDASGDSDDAEGDVDVDMAVSSAASAMGTSLLPPPSQPQQQAHLSPNSRMQPPQRTPSPNLNTNTSGHVKQQIPTPTLHSQPFAQPQIAVPHTDWQTHAQHMGLRGQYEGVADPYIGLGMTTAGMREYARLTDGGSGGQ